MSAEGGAVPWVPDAAVTVCSGCALPFTVFRRRSHCRACGRCLCRAPACSDIRDTTTTVSGRRLCSPCFTVLSCEERGEALGAVYDVLAEPPLRSAADTARVERLVGEARRAREEMARLEADSAELGATAGSGSATGDTSGLAAFAARMNELSLALAAASDELLELRTAAGVAATVVARRGVAEEGEEGGGDANGSREQALVVTREGLVALTAISDPNEAARGLPPEPRPRLALARRVDELLRVDEAEPRAGLGPGAVLVWEDGVAQAQPLHAAAGAEVFDVVRAFVTASRQRQQQARQRLGELLRMRRRAVTWEDGSEGGTGAMLERAWKALGDGGFPGRRSELWKGIGFQGDDPVTDFRAGTGFLGLHCLVYFAERRTEEARAMLARQPADVMRQYPLAVAVLNVVFFVLERATVSKGPRAVVVDDARSPQGTLLRLLARSPSGDGFERLVCSCMAGIDAEFHRRNACYFDFNDIVSGMKERFRAALDGGTATVEELCKRLE